MSKYLSAIAFLAAALGASVSRGAEDAGWAPVTRLEQIAVEAGERLPNLNEARPASHQVHPEEPLQGATPFGPAAEYAGEGVAVPQPFCSGCCECSCASDKSTFERLRDRLDRKKSDCHRRMYYHWQQHKHLHHPVCPPHFAPNWGYHPTCWRPFPPMCYECPPAALYQAHPPLIGPIPAEPAPVRPPVLTPPPAPAEGPALDDSPAGDLAIPPRPAPAVPNDE